MWPFRSKTHKKVGALEDFASARRVLFGAACARRLIFVGAGAIAMSATSAMAMEIYHCERRSGKTTWIGDQPLQWVDDFYGPSTVFIEGNRFLISSGSIVPDDLKGLVGDDRTIYELTVTSRDDDHVMGFAAVQGSLNAFQFHRPSKTLVNVVTWIENFPLRAEDPRKAVVSALVAKCF